MTSCGAGGLCYLKNDAPTPFDGEVTVTSHEFATGVGTQLHHERLQLGAGPGVIHWFEVLLPADATKHILTATVTSSSSVHTSAHGSVHASNPNEPGVLSSNLIPLTAPAHMELAKATVKWSCCGSHPDGPVEITLHSDQLAVFVTLTTLANGRFSDNALLLLPHTPRKIDFIPFGRWDAQQQELLQRSLRVEDVSAYM